jgi:hypothetical protein
VQQLALQLEQEWVLLWVSRSALQSVTEKALPRVHSMVQQWAQP